MSQCAQFGVMVSQGGGRVKCRLNRVIMPFTFMFRPATMPPTKSMNNPAGGMSKRWDFRNLLGIH
jgi:hypothetical protein